MSVRLGFALGPSPLVVVRFAPSDPVPAWALGSGPGSDSGSVFLTVTRTSDELSIVAPASAVPPDSGGRVEGPFASLYVRGTLEFGLVGIIASLADPLAAAGISIFVVSTFDTDWLLVPADQADDAVRALEAVGHDVSRMR